MASTPNPSTPNPSTADVSTPEQPGRPGRARPAGPYRRRPRRLLLPGAAALTAAALLAGAAPPASAVAGPRPLPAHAAPGAPAEPASAPAPVGSAPAGRPAPSAPVPALNPSALRAAIDDLEHPPVTAAQVRISGSAGSWYGASGVADLRSGRKVRPDDRFKVGSVTKVFVATVVLQLVAEGRVDLDTPIQHYLPDALPASYAPVTVEQLLNHTSGLPAEVGWPDMSTPEAVFEHRFDRWTREQRLATLPPGPMKFEPGERQEYRGINYVLAALLVEKVTGRHFGEAIGARLLRPLGLRHTSVPVDDPRIRGPHVRGYLEMSDGTLRDITAFDPSASFGQGEMISTTGDLTRFITALFSGRLLPPRLLDRMFTVPEGVRMTDGSPARYSTGLQTATVNGVTFWGKTGERYGYAGGMFATRDQQRRLVYAFNPTHRDDTQTEMTLRIADAATRAPGAAG